jgi:hypothetical protein
MHLFSIFVLRQSRKDADLCGKAACTDAVAAQPQQKKRNHKCSLIQLPSLLILRLSDLMTGSPTTFATEISTKKSGGY